MLSNERAKHALYLSARDEAWFWMVGETSIDFKGNAPRCAPS